MFDDRKIEQKVPEEYSTIFGQERLNLTKITRKTKINFKIDTIFGSGIILIKNHSYGNRRFEHVWRSEFPDGSTANFGQKYIPPKHTIVQSHTYS